MIYFAFYGEDTKDDHLVVPSLRILLMRKLAILLPLIILSSTCSATYAAPRMAVVYAGSMGVVMDRYIDPAFSHTQHIQVQGIGQGAWALAQLLASGSIQADVFLSVTPGPMRMLIKKGLVKRAWPVASTQMVIAYSPESPFAPQLRLAAKGKRLWYEVLQSPGLHLGRTDPETDPQGRNVILTFQLAALYYHVPGLVQKLLGPLRNPNQIFTESSLISRLQSGQIDAASSYLSAVSSRHIPYIKLPETINLSNPAYMQAWYSRVGFHIKSRNSRLIYIKPQPLVFYAAVLVNARHPIQARRFITFLQSPRAQAMFHTTGYNPPQGAPLP